MNRRRFAADARAEGRRAEAIGGANSNALPQNGETEYRMRRHDAASKEARYAKAYIDKKLIDQALRCQTFDSMRRRISQSMENVPAPRHKRTSSMAAHWIWVGHASG